MVRTNPTPGYHSRTPFPFEIRADTPYVFDTTSPQWYHYPIGTHPEPEPEPEPEPVPTVRKRSRSNPGPDCEPIVQTSTTLREPEPEPTVRQLDMEGRIAALAETVHLLEESHAQLMGFEELKTGQDHSPSTIAAHAQRVLDQQQQLRRLAVLTHAHVTGL